MKLSRLPSNSGTGLNRALAILELDPANGAALASNQAARDMAERLGLGAPEELLPADWASLAAPCEEFATASQAGNAALEWVFSPSPDGRTVRAIGRRAAEAPEPTPAPPPEPEPALDAFSDLMRQAVLRATEAVTLTRVEHGPEGPDSVIAFVNEAFERLTGYASAEAVGQTPRLLHGPETCSETLRRAKKSLDASEPFQASLTHYRKDGSPYVAEISAFPLSNGDGRHTHWVSFQRDATARREAERHRSILAAALEQTDDAIVLFGADGRVAYANRAFERARGLTRDQVAGQRAVGLRGQGFTSRMFREIRRSLGRGESWRGRCAYAGRGGDLPGPPAEVEATISPVRDKAGEIKYYAIVARDVSRETRLESDLRRAEVLAAAGEAVANISHQIKNILCNLRAGSQLIQKAIEKEDVAVIKTMWGLYGRATQRLETLARDMLAATRSPDLALEPVRLDALAEEIVRMCRPRAEEANVALSMEPPSSPPQVEADREALYDAALNIVDNAIEACAGREGARVLIETRCEPERGRSSIVIRDNGPGIPDEIRDRVFENFFTTKGSKGGTGLGLASARKTALAHGGSLELDSSPRGTTFEIRLPLDRSRPMQA